MLKIVNNFVGSFNDHLICIDTDHLESESQLKIYRLIRFDNTVKFEIMRPRLSNFVMKTVIKISYFPKLICTYPSYNVQ